MVTKLAVIISPNLDIREIKLEQKRFAMLLSMCQGLLLG